MSADRIIAPSGAEWVGGLDEMQAIGPPKRLHVRGLPLRPDARHVAVVGTRRPTAAGIEATKDITGPLVECGYTIVSGLAAGIDAVAHRTALEHDGATVAVLGCGLDVTFPSKNASLQKEIATRGTVVSEYPATTPPLRHHFPARNRIIAGLSEAVIVIEGGIKSGALITARLALDANREVFALPGSYRNAMALGPNELIRRCQATPFTSPEHVLEQLNSDLVWRPQQEPALAVEGEEREVLAVLDDVASTPDYIANALGLSSADVAYVLARLEVGGLAQRRGGGYVVTSKGALARGAPGG